MPTYDYVCRACGHQFEFFQSMTAPVKRKCPKCGKSKLERLIGTGAGIIFKGSGFYETDYRSDGYRQSAAADRKPAANLGAKDKKMDSSAGGGDSIKAEATPAKKEPSES